jgi:hypothetical protein
MSPAAQCRFAGAVFGVVFLLVLPAGLLGPVIFGGASLDALSAWVLPASCVSAAFGVWHLITAAFAYEEDLEFITGYFQAQEAVPLVLPFVLFVGTRSVYRRFFAPALVARRRWLARRTERQRHEGSAMVSAGGENAFPITVPREP